MIFYVGFILYYILNYTLYQIDKIFLREFTSKSIRVIIYNEECGFMDKILVTFYVLSLEEEFDVFIPINVKLAEVLDTVQQTISDMSEGNYDINPNPLLYSDLDGKLMNLNNIVKFSGLMNGSRVMIK